MHVQVQWIHVWLNAITYHEVLSDIIIEDARNPLIWILQMFKLTRLYKIRNSFLEDFLCFSQSFDVYMSRCHSWSPKKKYKFLHLLSTDICKWFNSLVNLLVNSYQHIYAKITRFILQLDIGIVQISFKFIYVFYNSVFIGSFSKLFTFCINIFQLNSKSK